MISDGVRNFGEAFNREFYTTIPRTRHISHIRLQGDHNNNGEVRDRDKDTPILTGYQIFHNYVRPYMGLDGETAAEASGIKVGGEKINGLRLYRMQERVQ